MSELLPCPFCGSEPEWINKALGDGHHYIKCPYCHIIIKEDRRDKAIGIWNKRQVRDLNEIQKAHDILASIMLGDAPNPLEVPLENSPINICQDVLCWVLQHKHSNAFADNIRKIKEILSAKGYELRDIPSVQDLFQASNILGEVVIEKNERMHDDIDRLTSKIEDLEYLLQEIKDAVKQCEVMEWKGAYIGQLLDIIAKQEEE